MPPSLAVRVSCPFYLGLTFLLALGALGCARAGRPTVPAPTTRWAGAAERCQTLQTCAIACEDRKDPESCSIARVLENLQGVELASCMRTNGLLESCEFRPHLASARPSAAKAARARNVAPPSCEPYADLPRISAVGALPLCAVQMQAKTPRETAMWLERETPEDRVVEQRIAIAVAQCTGTSGTQATCDRAVRRAMHAIDLLPSSPLLRASRKWQELVERVCAQVGYGYFRNGLCGGGEPLRLEVTVD